VLTNKHRLNEIVSPKSAESKSKVSPLVYESKSKVSPITTSLFTCKFCGKEYKHKQSITKHIKNSCVKKEDDYKELVNLLNMQIENQKKELADEKQERKKENQSLIKQIESLKGKLEIKGSFNTINNNITLNYKDTDVSHLTDNDYRSCIRKVCHSVLKLIEKIHFNPDKPENMNVYISNMRDKYAMLYEGNKWILKNKNEAIDKLYNDKEDMLEEWVNDKDEPEMRKFFDKYMNNMKEKETIEDINEQLKLMLYNKKNLIE